MSQPSSDTAVCPWNHARPRLIAVLSAMTFSSTCLQGFCQAFIIGYRVALYIIPVDLVCACVSTLSVSLIIRICVQHTYIPTYLPTYIHTHTRAYREPRLTLSTGLARGYKVAVGSEIGSLMPSVN